MGVWTKEEFYDALFIAFASAFITFCVSLLSQYLHKWVRSTKYVKE